MRFRPLGRTGLIVSELGFGGSPLGGVFGPIDEDEAVRAVRLALESGVTVFDTAPFYGSGRSERVLGRALAGVRRDSYVLSTKVGRYGEREFDFSAARANRSIEESLWRLGVSELDIVYCHDVEFGSLERIAGETIGALAALRDRGIVRAIGVSGLPLAVLEEFARDSPIDVVLSYCHANLYDGTLARAIPGFEARGIGVVAASPLAMGLLTDIGPPPWHPAGREIREACARAARAARDAGFDLARAALGYALDGFPGVATTLAGMATTREVRRNREAALGERDPRALELVRPILDGVRDRTWESPGP